jgi:hypothetical protein
VFPARRDWPSQYLKDLDWVNTHSWPSISLGSLSGIFESKYSGPNSDFTHFRQTHEVDGERARGVAHCAELFRFWRNPRASAFCSCAPLVVRQGVLCYVQLYWSSNIGIRAKFTSLYLFRSVLRSQSSC